MASMPNIAALLKSEISRVARKEVKAETLALKKAASTYRSEIAALKRRLESVEKELRRAARSTPRPQMTADADETGPSLRFSAKGLASQRKRLGLSAADCGLLVGASGLSIYKWESGQSRPRSKFLPALASLRKMGKRAALIRVASLSP